MHVSVLNFAILMLGLAMSYVLVRLLAVAPGWGPVMAVAGLLAALVTLVQPRAGLYLLVYSMLLSPGFSAGELGERAVEVRLDDVFLVLVFAAWFAIATLRREPIVGLRTPLIKQMAGYITVAAVSSLLGVMREDLGPRITFFFWLKYAQYFMLYYMTYNMIEKFERSKTYLWAGLLTAAIVVLHAYRLIASGEKPYCPFDIERGVKETATLGGYLLIICGVAGGVALYIRETVVRVGLIGMIVACIPPILSTGSRASYLAAVGILGSMAALGKGRRLAIVLAGVIGFYILPTMYGAYFEGAKERIAFTFTGVGEELEVDVLGYPVKLEVSAATRVRKWLEMINVWLPTRPFLGYGVTGVGLVDAQIPRVVGEVGILGFAFWAAMMWGLLSRAWTVYQRAGEPLHRGLAFGFLCVYIGLLVQSVGVNSFIIIRLMEPFWFLAAIVMRLYTELVPAEEEPRRASVPRLPVALPS